MILPWVLTWLFLFGCDRMDEDVCLVGMGLVRRLDCFNIGRVLVYKRKTKSGLKMNEEKLKKKMGKKRRKEGRKKKEKKSTHQ